MSVQKSKSESRQENNKICDEYFDALSSEEEIENLEQSGSEEISRDFLTGFCFYFCSIFNSVFKIMFTFHFSYFSSSVDHKLKSKVNFQVFEFS